MPSSTTSSLSELDSDTINTLKDMEGTPQKNQKPNLADKKSRRATKSTRPTKTPSPSPGVPQANPGTKKRSAEEAELNSSIPDKAGAKALQAKGRAARAPEQPPAKTRLQRAKPAKPPTPPPQPSPPKKRKSNKWEPSHLLHSSKSLLGDLDTSTLKSVLLDERAWLCLSAEEKNELIALLPEDSLPRLLDDNTNPDMLHEYLRFNEVFSDDVGRFLEQLRNGELDPEWQEEAAQAMERRARGDFDEWKEREWEEYWGQKAEFVPAETNGGGNSAGGCSEVKKGEKERVEKEEGKKEEEQGEEEEGKGEEKEEEEKQQEGKEE